MTTDQAIARLSKLREITVERGATQHEAATARAIAARLSVRVGLDGSAVNLRAAAQYATSATADRRSPRSMRFVASA